MYRRLGTAGAQVEQPHWHWGWDVWHFVVTTAPAVAAVVAVIVAVQTARLRAADEQRRREEAEARSLAQARLVLVQDGPPGVRKLDGNAWAIELSIANHSDRPILNVYGELWLAGTDMSERPVAVGMRFLPVAEEQRLAPRFDYQPGPLTAWRVRWTDADGKAWAVSRIRQSTPDRYTGQPPTRYPETEPSDEYGLKEAQPGHLLVLGSGRRRCTLRRPRMKSALIACSEADRHAPDGD
jgi:hypothetical protein